MPDIKEKLVELIDDYTDQVSLEDFHKVEFSEDMADHLIANGVTIQEWISVEERKPEPSHRVLVHYSGGAIEVGFFLSTLQQFTCEGMLGQATHWMPLPEPPKGE